MSEPIEEQYFNWLCAKVLDNSTREYENLMKILFDTEFVWVVAADEHRASDGLELRDQFLKEIESRKPILFVNPCSILEVLIAFASRAEFQTDLLARDWFWEFLKNLNLDQFNRISRSGLKIIENILYTFTWRIYEPNGRGGLFPMDNTDNDQREIEIWYQFCEYVIHRGLV